MRNRKSPIKKVLEKAPNFKNEVAYFLDMYKAMITQDMVRHYGDPKSFRRDFEVLEMRLGHEGFSFLTKTLPLLAKAVDSALTSGELTTPRNFKKAPGKRYPAFLQVLFARVFDEDGSTFDEPCKSAIKDLRQLLYLCYKYEVDYEETVITNFLQDFKETDASLGTEIPEDLTSINFYVLEVARTLLHDLFSESGISRDTCTPGHGPGAVATGEKNWEKMKFKRSYKKLSAQFPPYLFYYANAMELASNVAHYRGLEKRQYGVSKVALVPKDSRGPRMICMEPLEFQYIQQGLSKEIVRHTEEHELTRGHVNFSNQEINRKLALDGSLSGDVVTLDMKEASDRVSRWLVRELFETTGLWPLLDATRTEFTRLPNGEEFHLRKFAPMGSALCFPVESLVHWSLAVSTLHVYNEVSMRKALNAVYVYGDDIIIKGENHEALFDTFPAFKLRFNEGKCCTHGVFRESCGMDAVLGEEVIPIKVKQPIPVGPYDAAGYVSYIALSNTLWKDAYYSTSGVVDAKLYNTYGEIPRTGSHADCPGFVDPRSSGFPRGSGKFSKFRHRWNKDRVCRQFRVNKLKTFKLYAMEMAGMSSDARSKAVAEFGVSQDRSEYHRKVITNSDEFVAGIYTIPHRVKLQQGWSSDVM